uniref:Uncharacterized protein n=1 Tax=Meleagris gallopavo TaxID=9103 RepID=A0A803XTI2_MELGA
MPTSLSATSVWLCTTSRDGPQQVEERQHCESISSVLRGRCWLCISSPCWHSSEGIWN